MSNGGAKPYAVVAYTIDELVRAIEEAAPADGDFVRAKLHAVYFEEYFATLGAATMVVECEYVDRDYLEDYSAYYVRCFPGYERFCRRLHFFSAPFGEADLDALLRLEASNISEEKLRDTYLGFIVIKPLPETVIGRTCLATYLPDGDRRHYPIVQKVDASLFGIPLHLSSLPFQEQDQAVAACATSALWSVFHGTGRLFQHPIPSPVEITNAAMEQRPLERFTTRGLNMTQMARAIRNLGLEPAPSRVREAHWLRSVSYAYLRGRVPFLLAVALNDVSKTPIEEIGWHAVAVAGYSSGAPLSTDAKTKLRTVASRIDKLYAHDDQVGPFARMELDVTAAQSVMLDAKLNNVGMTLKTSWRGGKVRAVPDYVLVPLYHKIRIPFEVVHDEVVGFNKMVGLVISSPVGPLLALSNGELTWEVFLQSGNDLKSDLRREARIAGDAIAELSTCPLPRYVWRARALDGNEPLLEVLIDATDIRQGKLVTRIHSYSDLFVDALNAFVALLPAAERRRFKKALGWRILKSLLHP